MTNTAPASQARIVNVEALYSHPFDSAVAICARAAKRSEALSASAKVQLRVVPALLASVTVVPSNVTRAATPEGFFTFMRGANRVGTHVLLQARDACGNALTRDVPEGLEVLFCFIRTTLVTPLYMCAKHGCYGVQSNPVPEFAQLSMA